MSDLPTKIRRIEALCSENQEDAHPSFTRLEAASRSVDLSIPPWPVDITARYADPLGVEGIETFAKYARPSLLTTLIPAAVLLAFALGWFAWYVYRYGWSAL